MLLCFLTLEIPKIVEYYRQRWKPIETAFREVSKQEFGFDGPTGEVPQKHQSVRAVEFRRCVSDEVDVLDTVCASLGSPQRQRGL